MFEPIEGKEAKGAPRMDGPPVASAGVAYPPGAMGPGSVPSYPPGAMPPGYGAPVNPGIPVGNPVLNDPNQLMGMIQQQDMRIQSLENENAAKQERINAMQKQIDELAGLLQNI